MIELPTERRPIQQYNPRLLVLFGKPKSGKSTLMASLDNNLIIDLEDGYKALSVMSVVAKDAYALFDVKKALAEAMEKNGGKYPYKFITIDNATRLEEMALPYAAAMYRKTTMGASWGLLKDY